MSHYRTRSRPVAEQGQEATPSVLQKKTLQPLTPEHGRLEPAAPAPNRTGIPGPMKARLEDLSGFSLDDVRVYYHSGKPAQLQALAYTRGNQVYIGPGQERHLPHELGHVIQQKAGLVRPTGSLNGIPVNDDPALERAADSPAPVQRQPAPGPAADVVQRMLVPCRDGSYFDTETGIYYTYFCAGPEDGLYIFEELLPEGEPGELLEFEERDIQWNPSFLDSDDDDMVEPIPAPTVAPSSVHPSDFARLPTEQMALQQQMTLKQQSKRIKGKKGKATVKVSIHTAWGGPVTTQPWRGSNSMTFSNRNDFNGARVQRDYKDIFAKLKKSGKTDAQIATQLLDHTKDLNDSDAFNRAAAMLEGIVGLSEWARDKAAPKIFRAALREIADGKKTFADLKTLFPFIQSAQAGREQADRFRNHFHRHDDDHDGPAPPLSPASASLVPYFSNPPSPL